MDQNGTAVMERADHRPPVDTVPEPSDCRIFFAISDPTRCRILDDLRLRNGRRLVEISSDFGISRQAVIKHLSLLEEVGLVRAERGRTGTRYYLDRAPLRRAHFRWLAKYMEHSDRIDYG